MTGPGDWDPGGDEPAADTGGDGPGAAGDAPGTDPAEDLPGDDGPVAAARRALSADAALDRRADGAFVVTTVAFDATVRVTGADDGAARYRVTVRAPTLSAAVVGETVADVVETDWYEAFERRVADVGSVLGAPGAVETAVAREDGTVVVTVTFASADPGRAADDATAAAGFVEGTWLQGVVPGYEYTEPVARLLARARRRGDAG